MLYPKNSAKSLETELFQKPTSEYRATPFWAWNCKLDKETLLQQIEIFKEMGFGGFHMHARNGLDTPYLSDEFMEFITLCNNKAIQEEMLCWLYDEDRFPSGAAGGVVTSDLRFRARHLLLSRSENADFEVSKEKFDQLIQDGLKPKGYYLASYCVVLENGFIKEYKRIDSKTACEKGNVWNAFVRLSEEDPWYNDQTYVDVLNKSAINKFIEVTHERYFDILGSEFGKSVPAIFTDEPQVSRKATLSFAESEKDVTICFTDNLSETYKAKYGVELLDVIPELFWELPERKVSLARYNYHNHVSERFVKAFSDTLGEWCEKHNIALTGHFMSERTLYSQTLALGEAMRCYRSFQLPGIDVLCDAKEISTAKQAVSVARQYGREGVSCEMYGSTQWHFDFKGRKLQGDWLAALGVTIRIPHLAFMSMAGEGKRDWPASIGYQSPWYKEYPYIEDHFARLNTALTRGTCDVRIGVIHPIESFWLAFGPNDQTGTVRDQYDQNFESFISWMLYGLIDFDYISEYLLPEQCASATYPMKVGQMKYNTILVPDCRTLRKTTLERLEAFRKAGGRVIFVGSVPTHIDAVQSDLATTFASKCEQIVFNKSVLLDTLASDRMLEVRLSTGKLSDNLFHQFREDNGIKWLFICHVNGKRNLLDEPEHYKIKIKGSYNPTIYNTVTGEITPCPAVIIGGNTIIIRDMFAEDSILFRLEAAAPAVAPINEVALPKRSIMLEGPIEFSLSEPNALLLDTAEYSFDGGEFFPSEEVLRIDNLFRSKLGYPLRMDRFKQPWAITESAATDNLLTLRYKIESNIAVTGAKLAIENPENAIILINGKVLNACADGYFVDHCIKTVPLPDLLIGSNELIIKIPFGRKTNVEWCYLLGDFGVRVAGTHPYIEKAPTKLAFGDWVSQGLPFYAGNVTYKCPITMESDLNDAILELPHFSAPVIVVSMDGQRKGIIAYAPHRINLGNLSAGKHLIEIMVYGDRYNAFGTLHNANDQFMWYGPDSYRTEGSQWTESYLLRPMGILSNPVICK